MDVVDRYKGDLLGPDGKLLKELAQGYVSVLVFDAKTGEKIKRYTGHNTVVNSARSSAAAAFANQAGNVGLGFNVSKYRLGYQNVLVNHWDATNGIPLEVPFTDTTLLTQFPGHLPSPNQDYYHTQASVSGLSADGWQYAGPSSALTHQAIPLSVTYPFGGDDYAVQLSLTLDGTTSVGATIDTVEVVLANSQKFAKRWLSPITKQSGWGIAITHLILF